MKKNYCVYVYKDGYIDTEYEHLTELEAMKIISNFVKMHRETDISSRYFTERDEYFLIAGYLTR